MDVIIIASQFILSLSILIVLHEMGHFLAAKLFGMRVEKFYLFFNPGFSLFKVKKGETEYGLGWLPLGGYVKISGMIDESMDKEQMKQPPQSWEFRSKPAWQRLIVMIGGVTVNLILGVIIYAAVVYTYGEQYLPAENAKYGIVADSTAMELGLQSGDRILTLDNQEIGNFNQISLKLILDDISTIQIERDGEKMDLQVPAGMKDKMVDSKGMITPRIPFEIAQFSKESVGKEAGLKKRDMIVGINDSTILYFDQFKAALQNYKNKAILVNIVRDGNPDRIKVTVPESGLLGIAPLGDLEELGFEMSTIEYGFFESIPRGMEKAYETLNNYVKQIKLLFVLDKGYEKLGGFITIAKIFPTTWEWEFFWNITAFLSLVLALMNILPIPALDGGHVMFLLYEMISGKKPSDKVMEWSTYIGFALLISLLLLANGNDVIREVKGLFSN